VKTLLAFKFNRWLWLGRRLFAWLGKRLFTWLGGTIDAHL
jgi:hypothetical protein